MKEKEVYLTRDEIEYLIKGVIYWQDIENRVTTMQRSPIETHDTKESSDNLKRTNENDKRATMTNSLKKPLEGSKVYCILFGIGVITLGTWIYFVFA